MSALAHSFRIPIEIVALSALASWIYLVCFRGQFWRIRDCLNLCPSSRSLSPNILVLVPARDEASCIGKCVTSLLTQNYSGKIQVVVIDDNSSDDTAQVARNAGVAVQAGERLRVVSASPPPPGWTGKLWALAEGLRQADSIDAEYLLLTDADIVHDVTSLRDLVGKVQSANFDLVSVMVKLRCESAAERAFIPAFLFFFFMLYPPAWVANSRRHTAAAAGGCVLLRRETLTSIGGISSIRGELIDDCALAKRVKKTGGKIYLGATSRIFSLRAYTTVGHIDQLIARTAFTQLDHSVALLIGTLMAMTVVFIAPLLLLFSIAPASWMGAIAWGLMSLTYVPALRLYGLSPLRAFTLPAIALFYMGATVHSAVCYWRGHGGVWKGRVQDSISV